MSNARKRVGAIAVPGEVGEVAAQGRRIARDVDDVRGRRAARSSTTSSPAPVRGGSRTTCSPLLSRQAGQGLAHVGAIRAEAAETQIGGRSPGRRPRPSRLPRRRAPPVRGRRRGKAEEPHARVEVEGRALGGQEVEDRAHEAVDLEAVGLEEGPGVAGQAAGRARGGRGAGCREASRRPGAPFGRPGPRAP